MLKSEDKTLLVSLGFEACQQGKVAQGRDIFASLCVAEPENDVYQIGLAFSHTVVDEFEQAAVILDKILSAFPESVEAREILALTHYLSGQTEMAKQQLSYITHSPFAESLAEQMS